MEEAYAVIFNDDVKFIFTLDQLSKIPYFYKKIKSVDYALIPENDKKIFNMMRPSIGFEYLHLYTSLDEFDIIDPEDKLKFVIEQCKYFEYDKLKTQLENKFTPKIDVSVLEPIIKSKDLIGVSLKHHCTFSLEHIEYPYVEHYSSWGISGPTSQFRQFRGKYENYINESELNTSLYKFGVIQLNFPSGYYSGIDNSKYHYDAFKNLCKSSHMQYFKITLTKETINFSPNKEINEIYNKTTFNSIQNIILRIIMQYV